MNRRTVAVASVLLAIGIGLSAMALSNTNDGQSALQWALGFDEKPSIVFVVTDDQRWDLMASMPQVRTRVAGRGVTFANAFVVNSLCCPSRASILSGAYSHSTRVYRNQAPHGGFAYFNNSSTLPVWLSEAGYRNALVGKYLNGYPHAPQSYIPPGWDRWVAYVGGGYFNYKLNIDRSIKRYGNAPSDYLTDVLADEAVSWIKNTRGPIFLYFAPIAPHEPAIPAPRHADVAVPAWAPRPSFNEIDVSDKPKWVHTLNKVTPTGRARIRDLRARMHRSLRSVDEAVGRLLDALEETGRLSTTLFVFTSDNGLGEGEHRWLRKQVAYEESIRVPFVVRFDPLTSGPRVDNRLVLNIDLAPTAAELAGVPAKGAEGRSLLPLVRASNSPWRTEFLIEHLDIGRVPTYCAVRNTRFLYVVYETGEKELYDLRTDPYEMDNRASHPSLESIRRELHARVGALCRPPPPGMSPP